MTEAEIRAVEESFAPNEYGTHYEAGIELDALVAERVMGFIVERRGEHWRYFNDAISEEGGGRWTSPVPDYTTDIAAAWQVVEWMRGEDFWFSLTYKCGVFLGELDKPGYFARFRCVRGGVRGEHFNAAESAPLAICRAALLAVGNAS
jgi:hypothetical protein